MAEEVKTISRITLNGIVAADDDLWLYDLFGYTAFSPRSVREAIDADTDGELVLEINSGGGSVFAGFEIYSLLRNAKCRTVAEVQSLAASAASTIISGCSTVRMSPVAQVMLHLPSLTTEGNQADHRDSIRLLNSITGSILNGYESKCGGKTTRDRLETLMKNETWLTADEAVELGLADEIIDFVCPIERTPGAADVQNYYSIAALDGYVNGHVPSAAELKAMLGRVAADWCPETKREPPALTPCPDAIDFSDWRITARVKLEKSRFL